MPGFSPRPLKKLFTSNQCWTSFLDAGGLRDIEVVTKMLACGTPHQRCERIRLR